MSETTLRVIALIERKDHTEAERMLRDMGIAALPVLRELLENPIHAAKREWLRWLLPMIATPLVGFALFGPPEEWILTTLFLTFIPGLVVSAVCNYVLDNRIHRHRGLNCSVTYTEGQEVAAGVLTQIEDVHAIGLLLETIYWLGRRLPQQVLNGGRNALVRLLPQLTPETAFLLTPTQRQALLDLLLMHSTAVRHGLSATRQSQDHPHDVPLTLAILQAYTLIGDPKALKCVESIANIQVKIYGGSSGIRFGDTLGQQVVEKARTVLPQLRAHCEALQTGETLLRPSAKPEAAPEELLRPAQGNMETAPEQLLRAGPGHSELREK